MKIVCPSCDATYEVPDIVVTSRRKMRCARCTTDWVPADQMAAAAPEAAMEARPFAAEAAPVAPRDAAEPARERVIGDARPEDPAEMSTAELGTGAGEPPDAAAPEVAPDAGVLPPARRDDEPYQLALRPETHVSVFAPSKPAPLAVPAPAPRASRAPVAVAWAASIVILAAAVAGFLLYRVPVMKAWPPSVRLYAALGLTRP